MQRLPLLALLLCYLPAAQAQSVPPPAAQKVAEAWLKRLDADEFNECWKMMAPEAQGAVSAWKFGLSCQLGRLQIGTVRQRTFRSAVRKASVRQGQPQEILALQYDSAYSRKEKVREQVALLLGADGTWRVTGFGLE